IAVQSIEVSTNGGSTWNAAACSGCPGKNVTWTYSWSLPADGSYTIRSRATDTSGNVETPGTGNIVTVNRTGPAVSSTVPENEATGIALNSDVTINFSANMDCTTVTASTVTISPAVGWALNSCSGSQAVFSPSGQAFTTTYNITVTTGVKDVGGNPMAASYEFSYTTQACSGSLSITPGQTLYGNPIDLTSIITANNAANLNYTVGKSCPAQSNASIITKLGTWKYNGANNGDIGTTWKNTAFDDSGWSSGSGIFGYGETYINTLIGVPGQMSVYFRKTFTVCDAGAVTSLRFNATYDDGISVYINGVQVVNTGVTGNPPAWNGGAVGHESGQTYLEFNLDAYTGSLVTGNNVIAVGVYNINSVSSDLVFDGELVVSNSATGNILFTGNNTQAQSVDTTGWSSGAKNLEVTGDDAICLTPLTPATDVFTYSPTSLQAPIVTAFTATSPSTNLNIPITSFIATDNAIVTGYMITTSATPPLSGEAGWTSTAPAAYTVGSDGTYTLYPWARNGAGNVSAVFAAPRAVVVDAVAPEVSATIPADKAEEVALNSDVTIIFSENVDCTTVNTATITSSSPGWSLSSCSGSQAVFHTSGQAGLTTYTVTVTTGVEDIVGHPLSANIMFIYTTPDTESPVVTAFTATSPSISLTIPITAFTATDNLAVTGYQITTTATQPLSGDAGWTETAPETYTVGSYGTYALYPWAKDAGGNVAAVFATPRTVKVDATALPDLVVRSVGFTAVKVIRGNSITVTAKTKNRGKSIAGESTTRYYLSLNAYKDKKDILLTDSGPVVPALDAITSAIITTTVNIPANTRIGYYYIIACADDMKIVKESREWNNCRASWKMIRIKK
ncbi:MAG: Ig-like domain-containing protein, partial [Nitrospirae bacterium]|nr:Ig-like domain-containing protein [Nitrospirota bacterium]